MATGVRHDAMGGNISFALSDCYAKAEALARKVHSEARQIRESYREKQGLSPDLNLDSIAGVPESGTSKWGELTEEERLTENAVAFAAFHSLLGEVLKEQQDDLTPGDYQFHDALLSLLAKVEALAESTKQLLLSLGYPLPRAGEEREEKGLPYFEKKKRGYKVMVELCGWALRAVRGFSRLKRRNKKEEEGGKREVKKRGSRR
ncbi:CNTF factor, partial [Polyodon spathula]|nr:ciliary neurotrophic factor-like [Polyodon spathula]MBN3271152.1 CNTF factor [Polyodon spathula]